MNIIRIASYNIHKGVQGLGLARRLEIHNLGHAVEQMDADLVCLQEVRRINHRMQRHFKRWPDMPQADFLAPEGYQAIYRTNAFTRQGEHGNALLSRWPVLSHQHENMSDHRFEQRGLLYGEVSVHGIHIHVIVLHLGLFKGSRLRQLAQLKSFVDREVPKDAPLVVAGDFNDWRKPVHRLMTEMMMQTCQPSRHPTFPARLPLVQLDFVYARGMKPLGVHVPRGKIWWRMSDHLPIIAEFALPA
jgi:endonuclease/exonuclease/phosphatase family metal-dependent hydrolase